MPTLEAQGQRANVTLTPLEGQRWRCLVGDVTLVVEALPLGAGRWLLRHDGQQMLVWAATTERTTHLWLNGVQLQVTQPPLRPRRAHAAAGADLMAQMPGQIVEVRVSLGASVAAGEVLVVMEAMKMEIRVVAPFAGVVNALHVAAGQIVQRGQRLLDLQPVTSSGAG